MTENKNICIFSSLYLPNIGGIENYTHNLASELSRTGYKVTIVTCNISNNSEISIENNITVIRLPCHRVLRGRYPIPKRNRRTKRIWIDLIKQDFDYIIINARFYPLSVNALSFAYSKNVTPVVIEHGSAHLTLGNSALDKVIELIEHIMTKRCLRFPSKYYGVSVKASNWLKHFGINSCGELPNAINADMFVANASDRNFRQELSLQASTFLVAFVGRLVPEKGVKNLAKAAKLLTNFDIFIIVAGDGPLKPELSKYESKHFHLTGRLNHQDTAALLIQANVLCLPSRSEGFATTMLEAAACSTPTIATDIGGTAELILDSSYGKVLANSSPSEIAEALLAASRDPEAVRRQGSKVFALVKNTYSWQATARRAICACENTNSNNPHS